VLLGSPCWKKKWEKLFKSDKPSLMALLPAVDVEGLVIHRRLHVVRLAGARRDSDHERRDLLRLLLQLLRTFRLGRLLDLLGLAEDLEPVGQLGLTVNLDAGLDRVGHGRLAVVEDVLEIVAALGVIERVVSTGWSGGGQQKAT
jgi:hypothetical protein